MRLRKTLNLSAGLILAITTGSLACEGTPTQPPASQESGQEPPESEDPGSTEEETEQPPADAPNATQEKYADFAQRIFNEAAAAKAYKGLAVALIDGDESATYTWGIARDEVTVDADTVFEIGSLSKTMTALLLAEAVTRGELTPETTLGELLPEVTPQEGKTWPAISLEALATHRSGLPRLPPHYVPADPADPYAGYNRDALITSLGALPPRTTDAEPNFDYSNFGYGLLGAVLGHHTDQSFSSLVANRIAQPLGLEATQSPSPESTSAALATGTDLVLSPAPHWHFDTLAGAGAVHASLSDMLRYLRAHIDAPTEAMTLATTPRTAAQGTDQIGFGWFIQRDGTRWHNGMTAGFSAYAAFHPETRKGVIVLANTGTPDTDRLGIAFYKHLRGETPTTPLWPTSADIPAETLASYVGVYQLVPSVHIEIRERDGRLTAQMTNQGELPLFAESETVFNYHLVEARLIFDESGDMLWLDQGGLKQKATKVVPD